MGGPVFILEMLSDEITMLSLYPQISEQTHNAG